MTITKSTLEAMKEASYFSSQYWGIVDNEGTPHY